MRGISYLQLQQASKQTVTLTKSLNGGVYGISAVTLSDGTNASYDLTNNVISITVKDAPKTFDLALYNAVVDGMELGDLIFEGIPAKKDNQSWKFNVSRNVELLGGSIQADVDVNGVVTEKGDLSFVVAIVTPPIELTYKGKKKEN